MTNKKNNTGYHSTGYRSTGDWSTGDYSAGDGSTGYRSTGNYSTGSYSTGSYSTGYRSTGGYSTGDCSTGNWSTGYRSTGNWSTTDRDTGHFNTINPTEINVFNKPCSIEVWNNADKPDFLYFRLTEWVYETDMTEQEKEDNPTYETTGGYLKRYNYKEAFQKSYNEASDEDKALLLELPNFDAEVFKEISGIDVTDKAVSCAGKVVEIDGKRYRLEEMG